MLARRFPYSSGPSVVPGDLADSGTSREAQKKRPTLASGPFLKGSGDVLLSHVENDAVPSALKGFTAVFGMGTGGSPSP